MQLRARHSPAINATRPPNTTACRIARCRTAEEASRTASTNQSGQQPVATGDGRRPHAVKRQQSRKQSLRERAADIRCKRAHTHALACVNRRRGGGRCARTPGSDVHRHWVHWLRHRGHLWVEVDRHTKVKRHRAVPAAGHLHTHRCQGLAGGRRRRTPGPCTRGGHTCIKRHEDCAPARWGPRVARWGLVVTRSCWACWACPACPCGLGT